MALSRNQVATAKRSKRSMERPVSMEDDLFNNEDQVRNQPQYRRTRRRLSMKKTDQNPRRDTAAAHHFNVDVSHVKRKDPTPILNRACTELSLNISSCSRSTQVQLPSIRPTQSRRDTYNDLASATKTDLGSLVDADTLATPTHGTDTLPKANELEIMIFVASMGGILFVGFLGIIIRLIYSCCYTRRKSKERNAVERPVKRQRRHGGNREQRAARHWETAGREWSVEERRRRYREGRRSRNRPEAMADDIEMAYINQQPSRPEPTFMLPPGIDAPGPGEPTALPIFESYVIPPAYDFSLGGRRSYEPLPKYEP